MHDVYSVYMQLSSVFNRSVYRKSTVAIVLDNSHSLRTIYNVDHTYSTSYFSAAVVPQVEHTFAFKPPAAAAHPPPPTSPEPLFDNEDYSRGYIPPVTSNTGGGQLTNGVETKPRVKKSSSSSFKRSSGIFRGRQQPSLKRRDESHDNLLSDNDYDTLEPVVIDTVLSSAPITPKKPVTIRYMHALLWYMHVLLWYMHVLLWYMYVVHACVIMVHACVIMVHACVIMVHACGIMVHACVIMVHACVIMVHACVIVVYACITMVHACVIMIHACIITVHACVIMLLCLHSCIARLTCPKYVFSSSITVILKYFTIALVTLHMPTHTLTRPHTP